MLKATSRSLLFSRNDPQDRRLGDFAKVAETVSNLGDIEKTLKEAFAQEGEHTVILGYPDDDGIRANGGRVGAKEAPERIRRFLYKMTPPAFLENAETGILDLGDLDLDRKDIGVRHENAQAIAARSYQTGHRVLSFGGGHDYGFPDAKAYCDWAKKAGEKPLVINFDAHLDVRPMDRGITSGTPFHRLLSSTPEIDFIELGLQSQCNSRQHVEWAEAQGAQLSFEEERHARGESMTETLNRFLGDGALKRRSAFLSVDIDAFSSAVAPGASQSWATGFMPPEFFHTFSWCLNRFDVRGVGIYEVSPPLDVDDRTSRLAALIAHRFMFQL